MSVFIESTYPICSCKVSGSWAEHRHEDLDDGISLTVWKCSNCQALGREYKSLLARTAIFVTEAIGVKSHLSAKQYYLQILVPLFAAWHSQFQSQFKDKARLPLAVPPPCQGLLVSYREAIIGELWQLAVSAKPEINELLRFTLGAKLDPEFHTEFDAQGAVAANGAELREYLEMMLENLDKDPLRIFEQYDKLYG